MKIEKMKDIIENENHLMNAELIPLNPKNEEFNKLLSVYDKALNQVLDNIKILQTSLANFYDYNVIDHINYRIKTPESIVNKMKKKHYDLTYNNLIQKVNDIAGIRIICPFQEDIFLVRNMLTNFPNIKILKEKDYIHHPKKSGYSAYHLIVETHINFYEHVLPVKVEIQIRTMAMDFWSTTEHKMRYKSKSSLSIFDSKKLSFYAKVLNIIQSKIARLYQKQLEE